MIIFDPSLEEKEITEEVSKITSVIKKDSGEVVDTEEWGIRKLAYPIKHQENGYYFIIYFKSKAGTVSEIDRINKINDKILRHLIVNRSGNK